jgi:hypothetical protein
MRAPELWDDENIRAIKTQLEGLTKMVRNLSEPVTTPAKPSYAEILRRASPITRASERVAPVPTRRVREIVIAPGNESLTQRQRSGREIVSDINTKLGGEGVVAARRLPSGEVLVTFENEDQKKKGAKSLETLQAFGQNAQVKVREFTVLTHGIQVAARDTQNQAGAIDELYRQNPRLRGVVEIVCLGWAKKTIAQGKRAAPLHIGIAEPGQANTLIEQGLLFGSELHDCEVFWGDYQVTQCFNCYTYEHTARHCKNHMRCGFYATIGHASQDCPKREDSQAYRCEVCKGGQRYPA